MKIAGFFKESLLTEEFARIILKGGIIIGHGSRILSKLSSQRESMDG